MSLITVSDMKAHLGLTTTTDDTLLQDLIKETTALLESECNRSDAPFLMAAVTGRVEIFDGLKDSALFVDYPIAALTSIVADASTLDVADTDVIKFVIGDRRIVRVDGGRFGIRLDEPHAVVVTYDTQTDQPRSAVLAVKRIVSAVFNQRGTEGAKILIEHPTERVLAVKLVQFPETIQIFADDATPNVLCGYLFDLAGAFMSFYESCPIDISSTKLSC